jgi:hypothetical protein
LIRPKAPEIPGQGGPGPVSCPRCPGAELRMSNLLRIAWSSRSHCQSWSEWPAAGGRGRSGGGPAAARKRGVGVAAFRYQRRCELVAGAAGGVCC